MTNLLPCPFCGGEATVERIGYSGYYYVACNTAYCCDFGKFDTEAEAIESWNARATHGTLTAEQVRGTVEKHWHDLPDEYDMPEATALPEYSYDWQAIADELNAALDGETRWERLFGTPEMAARTSWYMLMCKHADCDECPISDGCDIATDIYCDDGEAALLEWLRGGAE